MNNQDTKEIKTIPAGGTGEFFKSIQEFEAGQRIAKLLSSSELVPDIFKDNIPNTLIALEIANRLKISPLAVLQNLYIIHGKPFWNSSFIISRINTSKRFTGLRYEMTGDGDERGCVAYSFDKKGERLDGPIMTIGIAKAEGLFDKKGSKWLTMSDLMLRYRAATLFGRLYAPEVLYGISTEDEAPEIEAINITPEKKENE